jgi:glycosyltransferase involved in cell wall biosynthesis
MFHTQKNTASSTPAVVTKHEVIERPVFSVVIPTYNRSLTLARALNSLNAQTFLDFEVLVCDDGSTDDTKTMVEKYRQKIRFRQLRYFYQPNWGGPARPRNTGVQNAWGEWICFLDSDDCWHPDKLYNILPYTDRYDVVYHDFEFVSDEKKKKPLRSRQLGTDVFKELMLQGHNGVIINSGICARKVLVQQCGSLSENRELIGVEDADLCLRLARVTNRFKHIPKNLGTYFLDGGNLTVYNQKMIRKLECLFDLHAPYLKKKSLIALARKTNDYHLGRIYQRTGNTKAALRSYLSSIGSPNLKLCFRSVFWISYLTMQKILKGNRPKAGYEPDSSV